MKSWEQKKKKKKTNFKDFTFGKFLSKDAVQI